MNPEHRLVSAEQKIEDTRAALYCLAHSLPIEVGHIPDAKDIERQRNEAGQITVHTQRHLNEIEDTFRAVRENGLDITFKRLTTIKRTRGKTIAESQWLTEPITAQYVGHLAIVGEQISQRRYGRKLTALVVSALEGVPREERLEIVKSDGTMLEPSVSPYQRRRRPEEAPVLKPRLASFKI